jgi:flagellar FliL protein
MATKPETPPPAPTGDGAPAAPKKRKLLIIIITVVVVLLLAGGGLVTFLLMTKKDAAHAEGEAVIAEKPKKDEKKGHAPIYLGLDPFTVNLTSDAGDQFLQVTLSLDVADPESQEKVKVFLPKIRNDIMLHLSGKKPSELATREGKEALAAELKKQINTVVTPELTPKEGKPTLPPVREVLFTSFIIQ